VSVHTSST